MDRWIRICSLAAALLLVASSAPAQVAAGFPAGWEATGQDFHPDGVWRRRARAVSSVRTDLVLRGDFAALNQPLRLRALEAPAGAGPAVQGTLRVPALLFAFQNTIVKAPFPVASYDEALFGSAPPAGRPYTLRTYYEQLSNGLFSLQGQSAGWVVLPLQESAYTGAPGSCPSRPNGNCNGIWSGAALASLQQGLAQVVAAADPQVDFGQFDNDGPDGFPNSGDDDGYIDVLMFLHAEQDGACGGAGNNHPWAHRSQLSAVTQDPSASGGTIQVRDYLIQSGVGGAGSCDVTELMAIGTAAHELGHGVGLPDLYDTSGASEGIGEWGLMGSGNYSSGLSPSRMESWSLNELGWVAVAPAATDSTYSFGAAPLADTTFVVNPVTPSLRGEYFLLENRQAAQSDTAMIRLHCLRSGAPPTCGGGMLIWHIDQQQIAGARGLNRINAGLIHGVNLIEADNLGQLRAHVNRGDAGDLYPGFAGNTGFSGGSLPAARLNLTTNGDGPETGFTIDQISQLVPGGAMSFRLLVGGHYRVAAADPAAQVRVDGTAYTVFQAQLPVGSVHQIAMDSPQLSADSRTRFSFNAWSDGGAQTHDITSAAAGDTIVAAVTREFQLSALPTGAGSIAAAPAVNLAGSFVADGSPVTLTATADPGSTFLGWSGDTAASSPTLILPMARPFTLTALFQPLLSIGSPPDRPAALMGKPYSDALVATGGSGGYAWSLSAGALPPGLSLSAGGTVSGIPTAAGSYQFTATVTSGGQSLSQAFTVQVGTPALASQAVVAQLLAGSGPLSADDLRYLDLLGNRNGSFDLGDFLAWVDVTGAPGAIAELTAARSRAAGAAP